jgi:hypothetical protein
MDLFDISFEESKNALFDYATELYGESTDAFFQVKGRDFEQCQYIDNTYGPFETFDAYCYSEFYSFCGYHNPNPVEYTEEPSNLQRKFI